MKALYLLLAACAMHVAVFAQNYYVNKDTGSDANSGTIADPFATIQHAADLAIAGDTVFIAAGYYNERVLCATNSGTPTAPIVFAHYGVYGNGPTVTGGSDTTGNSGTALWTLDNVHHITIMTLYFIKQYGNDVKGIWVKGNSSNITVIGCTFDSIRFSQNPSDNPTMTEHRAFPILVQGTSAAKPVSNLTFKNTWIEHCSVGFGTGIRVEGNVDTFLINRIGMLDVGGNCIEAFGYKGICSNASRDQPRRGIIRNNLLYGQKIWMSDNNASVTLDGCRDIIVERNRIAQSDRGLHVTCEADEKNSRNIIVRSNHFTRAYKSGLKIGKSDAATGFGKVKNCTVYGNTFYDNGEDTTEGGAMHIEYVEALKVHSNIFHTEAHAQTVLNFSAGSGADFHHNIYYHPPVSTVPKSYSWLGTSYATLAAYQTATGQDVGSQFADALFINNSGEFYLKDESPAINAGCPDFIPESGERDIDSLPRVISIIDCGAHETDIVTSVAEVVKKISYTISPNPASTHTSLATNANRTDDMLVLEIIDAAGKPYWVDRVNTRSNITDIDISNLAPGVYVLTIWNSLQQQSLKFIKQ